MSSPQTGGADCKRASDLEKALYEAVSSASSWLDNAENELVSGPLLLSDDSETHLGHLEVVIFMRVLNYFCYKKH